MHGELLPTLLLILAINTAYLSGQDPTLFVRHSRQLRSKQFWMKDAQATLLKKLKNVPNLKPAKNVIFFIGDGMSLPTITASRIYDGQLRNIIGERNLLSFEKFPFVGLSKTYCVDKQVSDSACTATAYMSGVKANFRTVGVTPNVLLNDCKAANMPRNHLRSIAGWAIDAGKVAGLVTNTRITHASPAGAYAHTANRDFESDFDVVRAGFDPVKCPDIAKQFLFDDVSRSLKVILGGGTRKFLPNGTVDALGISGERLDGHNLAAEWAASKCGKAAFVQSRKQLLSADIPNTDYLMGLFSPDHMAYHLDGVDSQPSLEEMTEAAIKMLAKGPQGFFLFVEGGRIDHAHHETRAKVALDETVQLSRAVKRAMDLTDPSETLIVVSADHAHTMTISGYSDIDNSITGLGTQPSDVDILPYATLSYANGPAFDNFLTESEAGEVSRVDLKNSTIDVNLNFQYPATVPLSEESHGGSDVTIYANGPWAHLFTGVLEQSALPALMGFAVCIGPGLHSCILSNSANCYVET